MKGEREKKKKKKSSKIFNWRYSFSAFLACKHAGAAMTQTGKGGKEISGGSVICTASGKHGLYNVCVCMCK
jgi:hypothetical protein